MSADQLDERPLTSSSSTEAVCTSMTEVRRDGAGGLLQSRHLSFLAGVLSLSSVADDGRQRATAAQTTQVVTSTVQLVLDAVLRRLERFHDNDDDVEVMSNAAAVHAVDVVARVADVTDAAVGDLAQQFARDVIAVVMGNQLLNQVLVSYVIADIEVCYTVLPMDCIKCCTASVCPSVPCLRLSRNRKAAETSNLVET